MYADFSVGKILAKPEPQEGLIGVASLAALFGILAGAGVIFIPGMAPLVIAGPITGVLAGWLEGSIVGGTGAAAIGGLAGALGGLGIPKNEVLKYETKIQAGEFIILSDRYH